MTKPQLFLLHFAGGNCYSYQFMIPLLTDFDVVPLELPGRGRRMKELLLKDFDLAARDFYEQVKNRICTADFVIFGHSMGAYLALRVAGMLIEDGLLPLCLFVTGNAGPGLANDKKRYLMDKDQFLEELLDMGGVPDEFVNNKELFNFFEPILRADFQIAETQDMNNESPVSVPIYAMMGSLEEKVEHIANWGRYTTSGFQYKVLEGDHFFIYKHPVEIASTIRFTYEEAVLTPYHLRTTA